ncbi:MAG: ABC transporter substrate-binding protein [Actinobacteria bacterium]|nr:ABC transporter substrate-binding protein [Actinomycetota bacterium]
MLWADSHPVPPHLSKWKGRARCAERTLLVGYVPQMTTRPLALAGAFLALTLAACSTASSGQAISSPAASSGGSGPIRIGVEGPLSGDQSVTGVGMVNGAQLAATDLNAKGGINGRQIEIVPIDDAADAATGVTAATAAIAAGLDGVVGPYNSGVGIETLPLYLKAGLVPIRLTSNSSTNSMGYTLQPMDYQIAPVAAKGLTTWLGAKKVAILYDTTQNYTTDLAESLKSELEAAGVVVTAFTPIEPGQKSYDAQVKTAAATSPDVIYAATYFPEGGLIAKAMLNQKVTAKCVADFASADPGFITTAGNAAAMNCPVVGVPSPGEFPEGKAFVDAYTAAFGTAPGTWSPYTYDSVGILAAAAAATGGFDATKLTAFLNEAKDWPGATGLVTLDPATGNRDPATVVFLDVDEAGEFHVDEAWATAAKPLWLFPS